MHALSKHLKRKNVDKEIRHLALCAFGRLIEIESFDGLQKAIHATALIFGRQALPENMKKNIKEGFITYTAVKQTKTELQDTLKDRDLEYIKDQCCKFELEHREMLAKRKLQRERSQFYWNFPAVVEKAKRDEFLAEDDYDQSIVENEYYSTTVLDVLGETYMPYFAFLSCIVRKTGRDKSFIRSTNSPVESYFAQLKKEFHTERKLKAGLFLRNHVTIILGLVVEAALKCNVGGVIKNKRGKKKLESHEGQDEYDSPESDVNLSTETWKGTQRRRTPRYVTRISDEPHSAKEIWKDKPRSQPGVKTYQVQQQAAEGSELDDIEYMQEQVVAQVSGIESHLLDIQSLNEGEWLNDLVISQYSQLLVQRYNNQEIVVPDFFLFSRKSRNQIKNEKREAAADVIEPVDYTNPHNRYNFNDNIFKHIDVAEKIVVIFHDVNHYYVILVDLIERSMIFYDSLDYARKSKDEICEVLGARLMEKFPGILFTPLLPECTKQGDYNACGLFAMIRVELILSGRQFQYEIPEADILVQRWRMQKELLQTTKIGNQVLARFVRKRDLQNYLNNFRQLIPNSTTAFGRRRLPAGTCLNISSEEEDLQLDNNNQTMLDKLLKEKPARKKFPDRKKYTKGATAKQPKGEMQVANPASGSAAKKIFKGTSAALGKAFQNVFKRNSKANATCELEDDAEKQTKKNKTNKNNEFAQKKVKDKTKDDSENNPGKTESSKSVPDIPNQGKLRPKSGKAKVDSELENNPSEDSQNEFQAPELCNKNNNAKTGPVKKASKKAKSGSANEPSENKKSNRKTNIEVEQAQITKSTKLNRTPKTNRTLKSVSKTEQKSANLIATEPGQTSLTKKGIPKAASKTASEQRSNFR